MSQTQRKIVTQKSLPVEELPIAPVEPETGSWEPYLTLIKDWQRADDACSKATDRAEATRKEEETRAFGTCETEKVKIESAHKERINALEAERRSAKDHADRLLTQVKGTQTRVREALGTVSLETLMDDIEVTPSLELDDATSPLSSLRDLVARSTSIEDSLQDDLFALRAARQRQSAQTWAVGIGLWFVALLVFAPYTWISALLVAVAVFIMGTPRKIAKSESLRPSFAGHVEHCIALLLGKQQVMQHPFSLVEKGRNVSSSASWGAAISGFIGWMIFASIGPPNYEPTELLKHLTVTVAMSCLTGFVTFAIANQDVTLTELNDGRSNKILR